MDEASLDNLLVPGARGMYDVDLVLRLVRVFVSERSSSDRMKKVAALVDAYMGEIAPEKSLKREKFVGMLRALPDGARTSYDGVYRAVDVFLQVRENFLLRVSHVLRIFLSVLQGIMFRSFLRFVISFYF